MTVTYTGDIGQTSGHKYWKKGFASLLLRWRGSVYRMLLGNFIGYVILYTFVSLIYRLALNDEQREIFEVLHDYFLEFTDGIPLGFVLGFYCSLVAGRWWSQFQAIPWPDSLCMNLTAILNGEDEDSRMMRRNIARYANLAINITFVKVSTLEKDRFSTLEKYVEEGFLTKKEKDLLDTYHKETKNCKGAKDGPMPDFWIPLVWATNIVNKARAEGKISSDIGWKTLLAELTSLRGQCGGLQCYAWINIPLVYTQVVTIATYSFFLTTLISRQYIIKEGKDKIDLYIPFVTLLQFIFYFGWLKTAESMINPFGGDDDDFEIDDLINRNHEMGYILVDKMHSVHPELSHDDNWESILPPGQDTKELGLRNECNIEGVPLLKSDNGKAAV